MHFDAGIASLVFLGAVSLAAGFYAQHKLRKMHERKDQAYEERNRVVAAFARACLALGYQVGRKATAIEGWNPEWNNCLYIQLPDGRQWSWHYHESHEAFFADLPAFNGEYNGHTTDAKYAEIAAWRPSSPRK